MNAPATPYVPTLALESATRITFWDTSVWIVIAGASFHLAYLSTASSLLIVLYLFALLQASQANSWRKAFYAGLAVGFLIAVPRLDFFWRIFGAAAIALWFVYAFWIGVFAVLARCCFRWLPTKWGFSLIPFLWCGLEYFRCELYYLRFSWLTPGLAFGSDPNYAPIGMLGTYGTGFVLTVVASSAALRAQTSRAGAILVLLIGTAVVGIVGRTSQPSLAETGLRRLSVAGVQLEFPSEKEVLIWLNELARRHPEAELLVLSEYTFTGPIPETVKTWCREHRKHLVIGGKERASDAKFFNTAFVISPSGEIVFRQSKSVPIQFFDDGLPAEHQAVWQSQWGKLGICICYDLSYTRVTDRLVELGAQALVVPTMDVTDWGKRQHELHARIGPVRAAEYHVPIFRLASSGISQAIDPAGRVIATAPFPGQGAMIAADLPLPDSGRRPFDRWLAPTAAVLTGVLMAALAVGAVLGGRRHKPGLG